MLKNLNILILITLLSFNAVANERLSFYKLILSPEEYEDKGIYLTGYFVSDGKNCLVISNNKETALMYKEYEMVRFCKNNLLQEVDVTLFDRFKNNYGSVVGTFSMDKCGNSIFIGRTLRYLGCFTKVTQLYGPIYEGAASLPPPPFLFEVK